MVFDFPSRLRRLQKKLASWNVDCAILGGLEDADANAFYYSGENAYPVVLVVSPESSAIFSSSTNGFFDESLPLKDFKKNLFALLKKTRAKRIGVDEQSDSVRIAFRLMKRHYAVKPIATKLGEMRLIKDEQELRLITQAQKVSKDCVSYAREKGFAGKTENQVAGLIELAARERGYAANSFPPIVACNEHAAFPHWVPSQKKISRGDLVLIDAGVQVEGYCGDFSQTFYDGSDKQIKDAISAVKEAQKAAVKKAKPGVKGEVLSKAALCVLKECGFEKTSFKTAGLSLGHFVGLQAHDSSARLDVTTLKTGMAFAIEPGIYAKGKFGVRFEDLVLLH